MRPTFYPRLINGPFDDPGLFVPFFLEQRALMFDLGEINALSPRDIHKISHIFITHTHMDHFIGFDRLLRLFLGRDQSISMYGPKGFIQNVEGKLAGYAWNLVKNYSYRFSLLVSEVHPGHLISREYLCRNGFLPASKQTKQSFEGIVHREAALTVSAELLDHDIPCLGFRLQEGFHINIRKERVAEFGLETGPWLNRFKQALFDGIDPQSEFEVRCGKDLGIQKRFVLGKLAEQIALITPGQVVAYIADAAYSQSNVEKIVKLAKDADHLFIEAAFLEEDRGIAAQKDHLTAWQAGRIAGLARAKQFTPFHFSPRYTGREHLLEKEARQAYDEEVKKSRPAT